MKKSDKIKRIIIYIAILVVIIFLIFILSQRALNNYHSFRAYQGYFKNNTSPKIEDWMTPHTILRHFNISQIELFQELNVSNTRSNLVTPLKQICQKKKIDCAQLIERLNNLGK